jgi:hypothetical protein
MIQCWHKRNQDGQRTHKTFAQTASDADAALRVVQTAFCVETKLCHTGYVFRAPHLLQILPQSIAQLGAGTFTINYNPSLIGD